MKFRLSLLLLLIVVLTAGTFATTPANTAATETNWSGFYLGVQGGYTMGKADAATTTVFSPTGYFAASSVPAIATVGAQALDPSGVLGGIRAGYNFQFDKIVLGLEADFSFSGLKGTATGTAVYPCCAPTDFTIVQTVTTSWLATARARLGYSFGALLVYATGGLAMTNIDYQSVLNDTFAKATENGGLTQTLTGYTFGGGLAYQLSAQLAIMADYLYLGFGDIPAVTSTNLAAFTPPIQFPKNVFTHKITLNSHHVIRAGFTYRFG
jgi:outer membrane immunogenic protein